MGIDAKGPHERGRHLMHRRVGIEVSLFFRVGDKTHLEEYRWTGCLKQHPERSLLHAAVGTVEMPHEMFLYLRSELQGLVHEIILHQLEHDIRVNRVRVEALIGRLVVRLQLHHRVLTHRHIEVLLRFLVTEDKRLHTFRGFVFRCVSVNGDEQVGIVLIGNVGARLQRNEHIRRTRIYHIHIGILLLEHLTYL